MGEKFDKCVKDIMGDPNFKPQKGKTKEQSAFAICTERVGRDKKQNTELKKGNFDFYFDLHKSEESTDDSRIVEGYANIEETDRHGEIIMREAFKGALSEYMKNPIMRYMHNEEPIGKIIKAKVDEKGLFVKAELVNSPDVPLANKAWALIEAGVVKAFSIGGRVLKRGEGKKANVIEKLWLAEISVVDIPANKNSLFTVVNKAMNEVIQLAENKKDKEEDKEEEEKEADDSKTEEKEKETQEKESDEKEEDEEEDDEDDSDKDKKSVETELRKEVAGLKKQLDAKPDKKIIKEAMVEILKEAVKIKKRKSQVDTKEQSPEDKKKADDEALLALTDTTKDFGGDIDY